jgi:O-antigen/teichoic acid export membrane protein
MTSLPKEKPPGIFGFLNSTGGSLRSRIVRSGFWQALTTIGVNSLLFAKSVILARLLAPEVFGLMSLALMTIRGTQLITDTGFGPALIQRKGDFDEAKHTAFTLFAVRGAALAILMVPLGYGMAAFYDKPQLFPLVAACGLSFLFSGFTNIGLTAAVRDMDFKKIAIIENTSAIASFAIALVIAFVYRSVWALVVSFVVATAARTFMSYAMQATWPRWEFNRKIALELLRYGRYITGSTILLFIASEIDTAVIGKLLDLKSLGHYSVAFMLANFPAVHVAFVISNIMFPAYSSLQNEPERLAKAFLRVMGFVASLVLPVMTGMAIAAHSLIGTLYGSEWLEAVIPFQVLCIYGGLHAVVTVNGYMFNAIGRPDVGLRIAVVRLGGVALVIFPAIIYGGTAGAACAMSSIMCVTLAYGLGHVSRLLGLRWSAMLKTLLPAVLKSMLVAVVMIAVFVFVDATPLLKLAAFISAGAVVYIPANYRLVMDLVRSRK